MIIEQRFNSNIFNQILIRTFLFLAMGFAAAGLFAAPLGTLYPKAPNTTPEKAREMVLEAAKKYIGTPYVHAGMSSSGLDCSGFVCLSFEDALGVIMPRSASGLHVWAEGISLERIQPGDLLFFRTGDSNAVTHVGLYVGERRFLHSASAGPQTGVIYSSLDEQYYIDTYTGAGRALPASSATTFGNQGNSEKQRRSERTGDGPVFIGAAFAPTWDFYQVSGNLIRGYTSQIIFGFDFGDWLAFGFELRPEWDGALGVFRIPLTFSWGHRDTFRIFFGPVLSFDIRDKEEREKNGGEAGFNYNGDYRVYFGGTRVLGAVGITYAPFTIRIGSNQFAPYIEGAWQTYLRDNPAFDFVSDFTANFRVSTGLRWKMLL